MKIRLGRGATIAAGAVALSLFAILCMLPYGREDFLAPERILARKDALRFRIASLFVEPFGAGAYLGLGLVFVWSVIGFFRESIGAVIPRAVGLAAAVPSFCAMTSLGSGDFWAGSFGVWLGSILQGGFGPVLGGAVVGALFLVSMALATEFGFHTHLAGLRSSLSFPLLPPEAGAAEGEGGGIAVLEAPDPAEALIQPGERPVEALEEVPGDPGDVKLVDRQAHVLDIRRRLREGLPVTDAELDILDAETASAANREEAMAAMDSLFGGPEMEAKFPRPAGAPAAPEAPAPDAGPLPFRLYEVPPFLTSPGTSPALLGQEVAADAPILPETAVPPSGSAPPPPPAAEEPPPSHARVIPGEAIAAAGTETEDLDPEETSRVVEQAVAWRSPYIFAGVEFLPPNEELVDPLAEEASAPAPVPPETEEEAAAGPEEAAATAAEEESGEGYGGLVVEDEVFSFGLEEEEEGEEAPQAGAPAGEAMAEAAPQEGEPAEWLADAAAELARARAREEEAIADAAPCEEPAGPLPIEDAVASEMAMEIPPMPPPAASGGDSAAEAFRDETFPEPPPAAVLLVDEDLPADPAAALPEPPEPEIDPDDPAAVLARLFGEPVTREEALEEMPPAGPAHSEPREPPAASAGDEGGADPVTLLSDPDLGTCITDHGLVLDLDELVQVPDVVVVDDDSVDEEAPSAPPPAKPLSVEEAADAIIGSLTDLFGQPIEAVEPPAPSGEDQEDPPEHHPGFGTLFPFMDGAAAPGQPEAPAPVVEPLDETEIRNAEEPPVDEALVSRLVEEFRGDEGTGEEEAGEDAPAPAGAPDDLYDRALEAVRERGRGSVVLLQRRLGIGFTRATRLLELLVSRGVLGPENAAGSHPVL